MVQAARDAAASSTQLARQQAARVSIARMAEPNPKSPREIDELGIVRVDMRHGRVAHAFRDLRAQLVHLLGGGNGVIAVAPARYGSGGSFVATNLAAAFAFDETKTALLVDCDLRAPVQHERLRVAPVRGGLTDFIEDTSLRVESLIHPTGIARLRLVPAGHRRETIGEHLGSLRMRSLIEQLRERYPDRYLILDAPPLSQAPDARTLAQLADLTVVVGGYGRDTPAAIARATLGIEPSRLAGVVFNQVP